MGAFKANGLPDLVLLLGYLVCLLVNVGYKGGGDLAKDQLRGSLFCGVGVRMHLQIHRVFLAFGLMYPPG